MINTGCNRTGYRNVLLIIVSMLVCFDAFSKELPDKLTIAILVKVVNYSEAIKNKNTVAFHVVADAKLARKIREYISDKRVGKKFVVTSSNNIPDQVVDVVFVSSKKYVEDVVEYTRRVNAISVTNNVSISGGGVTLIIFDDEGVPGILINTTSSRYEGVRWDPEILEIVKVLESVE